MNIGLSLPLGYLTGSNDSTNVRRLTKALGSPEIGLSDLKDQGVSSIELQGFGPDASASSLLNAVQLILGSGMRLTLHGYLTTATTGHRFDTVYPQLVPTMKYLKQEQPLTIMVVHALTDPGPSNLSLLESTVQSLSYLTGEINGRDVPLRMSLEINRYHGVEDPGTSYDSLLVIADHLGNTDLGFCWDMGHTQSSVLQGRLPVTPPQAFTRKVIHTHVHGLAPDGDTHRSLMESNAHVASAICQLKSAGYNGTYNLELYPARWGSAYPVREGILGSIHWLQTYLTTYPN